MAPRHLLAAALLLAVLGVGLALAVHKSTASELYVYTLGAERMMHGEPVYRVGEPKPFTYPPFFALPFIPFVLVPERWHQGVFFLVNAALLALVVRLLARRLRPLFESARAEGRAGPRAWPLFWAAVVLVAGFEVNTVFEKHTHDFIVFLLLALAIDRWCDRREVSAGVFCGLAAACKATPALFLVPFVMQRRWRAAATLVIAAALATALPDLVFPAREGGSWTAQWYRSYVAGVRPGESAETPGEWTAWNMLNQNLAGGIHRLSTAVPKERENNDYFDVSVWSPGPAAVRRVTLAAQAAVLALVAIAGWKARQGGALVTLAAGGATLCAMVLLSPWSSKTHFCVLLVPVAACLAQPFFVRRAPGVLAVMAACALIGVFTAKDLWGRDLVNELLARGSLTGCALLGLGACVRVVTRESHSDESARLR